MHWYGKLRNVFDALLQINSKNISEKGVLMILREYGNKALPFVLGYHKLENIIPVLMSIGCKGCEINHLNFEYISTMNPVPFELLSSFLRHQMIQYRRALSTHY